MISVTILTKNNAQTIEEVLTALKSFDEVVVYDTGSKDETHTIAKKYNNVVIFEKEFIGFGPTHNKASKLAKNDWILSIDSDEVVTSEMLKEITSLKLDENSTYSFPRHNFFNGKFIKFCGWYPDRVTRLYNRKKTVFSEKLVHEGVKTEGLKRVSLKGPLEHYSYKTMADFLNKMQLYSDLFAAEHAGKKRSSLMKAIFRGFYSFFKSYILKRGFMGGYEGFVISLYNGHTAYYKYLKLMEANKKLRNCS